MCDKTHLRNLIGVLSRDRHFSAQRGLGKKATAALPLCSLHKANLVYQVLPPAWKCKVMLICVLESFLTNSCPQR